MGSGAHGKRRGSRGGWEELPRTASKKRVGCRREERTFMGSKKGFCSLSDELLDMVFSYSTAMDLCRLQTVSRNTLWVASAESLWKLRAEDTLTSKHASVALTVLRLSSYKQLVQTFRSVAIPGDVVGYWRADIKPSVSNSPQCVEGIYGDACRSVSQFYNADSTGSSMRGELLRIMLVGGGFFCESIEPDGETHGVFGLAVLPSSGKAGVNIKYVPFESGAPSELTGFSRKCFHSIKTSSRRMIEESGDGFFLWRNGVRQRYVKLDQVAESTGSSKESTTAEVGNGLSGLWSAPYGSHGLEILQVKESSDVNSAGTASQGKDSAASRMTVNTLEDGIIKEVAGRELVGTKVIGDSNVPAGKCSFVIDLDRHFDPYVEVDLDSRPVVSFLPTGATIGDLSTRVSNVKHWFKGKGQINRIPGVWNPEWVVVDCLEYKSGPKGFSVVWSEPNELLKVVVDFERLDECGVVWPDVL
ncbi:unnamed protein product [Discosporangium mesarthrocarpum]